MNKNFPKIVAAKALENYTLFLSFDDGVLEEINLGHYKGKGIFEYWNDENNFKNSTSTYLINGNCFGKFVC